MDNKTKKHKYVPHLPAKEEAPAPVKQEASQDAKRKPVMTYRVDDCSCSIWAREYLVQGNPKTFVTCTFERSYKDRNGAWKYTKSFDAESLGKVATLCQQASEYIHGMKQEA